MNFHINLAIAYLYVLWRFIIPLPVSIASRITLGTALLVISKYHLILLVAYGTMFSPEVPYWMILIAGWAFCAFVLLFLFTLLTDIFCLLARLFRLYHSKSLFTTRVRGAISALAIFLADYGVFQAVQVPNVNRVEIAIPDLPDALDGYHLVQLTDLHISKLFAAPWVQEVVARTNALKADLIVITGDLIDGTTGARQSDVAPLARLTARDGVISIPGNHEYYFDNSLWVAEFERLGMRMLQNQNVVVGSDNKQIVIAGVTDEAAVQYGFEGPNLNAALLNAPMSAPTILLKHRPQDAQASAQAGVDLQLSGHTHGGMIKGIDMIAAYANQGYVSGKYSLGNMTLYVSNGTALWNGFPIRLGVPAEITSIVLRRQ